MMPSSKAAKQHRHDYIRSTIARDKAALSAEPDEGETVADVFYRTEPHPQASKLAPGKHAFPAWVISHGELPRYQRKVLIPLQERDSKSDPAAGTN
jgi:hypothetical protein